MNLGTRCPWCETVFRMSKEQAAASAGMVRCGACNQTFNSLDHLVEDRELARLSATATPYQIRREVDDAFGEAALGGSTGIDWSQPPEDAQAAADDGLSRATSMSAFRAPQLPGRYERDDGQPSFLDREKSDRVPMSRSARIGIALLSLVALLALAAQAAYTWRNDIASQVPALRPVLASACIPIGCRVTLPGEIGDISIESSDLHPVPTVKDMVVFTALLRNRNPGAQRYPDVELTLTNAQNEVLVRRVFSPDQYLPASVASKVGDGLAPNTEQSVKLVLDAPGLRVTDYHTVVFYP